LGASSLARHTHRRIGASAQQQEEEDHTEVLKDTAGEVATQIETPQTTGARRADLNQPPTSHAQEEQSKKRFRSS
jgi:hypothetical protein